LEKVNNLFNSELQSLTPENADSKILMLGRPSEILLKYGIEDKPLKYYGNKLIKKQKKHGFGLSNLKDLPKAVANPIAIFKGNRYGSFAVLTEIEINGSNILVTLEVGKDRDVDFNIITSTYEKAKEGLINWVNESKTLYINKEKAPDYLGTLAPIASASNNQGLINNIENLSWHVT
jgi:hypothetical protein